MKLYTYVLVLLLVLGLIKLFLELSSLVFVVCLLLEFIALDYSSSLYSL